MRTLLIGPMAGVSSQALAWSRRWLSRNWSRSGGRVIAVDGGLDAARKLGLEPDLAIGDWDSVKNPRVLANAGETITLPREKDFSDFRFAIESATLSKTSVIKCIGFTGGRPDHALAVLLDLAEIARVGPGRGHRFRELSLHGPEGATYFLSPRCLPLQLRVRKGTVASLFAFGNGAKGVRTKGFQYHLPGATLRPSSHGLSNVALSPSIRVAFEGPGAQGVIAVILPAR